MSSQSSSSTTTSTTAAVRPWPCGGTQRSCRSCPGRCAGRHPGTVGAWVGARVRVGVRRAEAGTRGVQVRVSVGLQRREGREGGEGRQTRSVGAWQLVTVRIVELQGGVAGPSGRYRRGAMQGVPLDQSMAAQRLEGGNGEEGKPAQLAHTVPQGTRIRSACSPW